MDNSSSSAPMLAILGLMSVIAGKFLLQLIGNSDHSSGYAYGQDFLSLSDIKTESDGNWTSSVFAVSAPTATIPPIRKLHFFCLCKQ
jgi:hypothetical protein